jgi:transposase
MKAYSIDLRERVIKAVDAGKQSQAEVAATFGIARRTVELWWQRWRETQSVAALPHGGGPARVLAESEPILRAALKAQPDATLDELIAQVAEAQGLTASQSMMCRELHRLKLPRKKRPSTTARGTRRR